MKDQCYEFIKNQTGKPSIVGFGSYGQVKIAKNLSTNQIVAIKLIHGKNAKQQIDVHHKLNHSNIIKLINYYYEKQKNITYMVLQYAEGGSLNDKIKFGYGHLPKQLVHKYFKDVCEAIRYLHHHNYMHRDIKPENILIARNNTAKLCDFGFAAILQYRSTMCGTFQYMAPQMIKKRPYDYKIDIWALGILLFELIQGVAPFKGQTGEQVIAQMKKPIKFSNRFSTAEIDLIKKILRVNSQNRPTIDEILQHPYFKQFKEQQKKQTIQTSNQNKKESSNSQLLKQNSRDNLLSKKIKEEGFTSSKQQLLKFPNSNLQKQENKNFSLKKLPSKETPLKKFQLQKPQLPQFGNLFNNQAHLSFSQISTNTMNSFIQNESIQKEVNQQTKQKAKQSTPITSPSLNYNFKKISPTKVNTQEEIKRKNSGNVFQPSFLTNKKMNFYNPISQSNPTSQTQPKIGQSSFFNNNKKVSLTQKLNYDKHNSSYSIPSPNYYKHNEVNSNNLNITLNNQPPYNQKSNNIQHSKNNLLKQQTKDYEFEKDSKDFTKQKQKYQKSSYQNQSNFSKVSHNSTYTNNTIKTQPSMTSSGGESQSYIYTKKLFGPNQNQKIQPSNYAMNVNINSGMQYSSQPYYKGNDYLPIDNYRRQFKPIIGAKKM